MQSRLNSAVLLSIYYLASLPSSLSGHPVGVRVILDVFAALRAQDVVAFGEEAAADQGHGALLAVEAVVVPLALLEGNVLAASKAADGGGAGGTLLGIKAAEAVEAVGKVIPGGEPLARQLLLAAGAQEAVLVPGLVAVGHPAGGDGLLAVNALHGKLLLVAGHAEVVVVLGDEALGTDGLLAPLAGEAGLVPAVPLVLHLPGAWHDGFLALVALGGILVGVALGAQQLLVLGGEGLVHQGALALEALEAVLVPVAVLVGEVPGVAANGLLALLTGVGVQALVTFHAVGVLLSQHVLLPEQGLLAVVAVVALGHFDAALLTFLSGGCLP